jgi:prepilin-type N-terminal cleavage/methylation domain-containing protein
MFPSFQSHEIRCRKFYSSRSGLSAFTLIELLVVIAIIVILIGFLFPAFRGVQDQAKRTQAKNDLTQIVTAVNAYYTEYGKYPVNVTDATKDAFFGTGTVPTGTVNYQNNDVLVDVLRNNTASANNAAAVTSLNARGIVYADVASVKNNANPRSGLIPNGATGLSGTARLGVWYDPWGSPYNISIDTNYDNKLTNPYQDTSPPGGATLTTGVISWSFGTDGKLGNNGDNLYKNTSGVQSDDVISWQ